VYVSRVVLLIWNYHSTAVISSKREKRKENDVVVASLDVSIIINWPGVVEDWKAKTIEITSVSHRA
jgi:hypothetical protein